MKKVVREKLLRKFRANNNLGSLWNPHRKCPCDNCVKWRSYVRKAPK